MPIMCSRIRTLSARIFRASLSCCTASPWTAPACLFRIVFQMRSGGEKKKTPSRLLPRSSLLLALLLARVLPVSREWNNVVIYVWVCVYFMQQNNFLLTGRPCSPVAPGGPWQRKWREREKKKNVRFLHFYPLTNLPLHPISSLKSS